MVWLVWQSKMEFIGDPSGGKKKRPESVSEDGINLADNGLASPHVVTLKPALRYACSIILHASVTQHAVPYGT